MNKETHQEYLTELKRHKWKIVPGKGNHNCIHPVEENLTCGEYKGGLVKIIPQGEINYPKDYARDRDFWVCAKHASFYQIVGNWSKTWQKDFKNNE